jgi:hypothetical protein
MVLTPRNDAERACGRHRIALSGPPFQRFGCWDTRLDAELVRVVRFHLPMKFDLGGDLGTQVKPRLLLHWPCEVEQARDLGLRSGRS